MCYVSLLWGVRGSFVASLCEGSLVVVFCFSIFWGFMGLTKNGTRFSFWLVELVGEAFFRHLEFSSIVFDVVYTEGV